MSGTFADRMGKAEQVLSTVTAGGYNPTNTRDVVAGAVPFAGNFFTTPEGQQYKSAQEDWVRAKLRKESGAVIGEEEMAREITTYFPQPGDGPEVIAQKAAQRATAQEGMARQAGAAVQPPAPKPPTPGKPSSALDRIKKSRGGK